ncbi:MAG: efflux RND transporter periplasmic adaptor subunit [Pseudomonadota bacterium]
MTEADRPSLFHRILGRTVTISATLLVIAGAGFAVFIGSNTLAERAEATQSPTQAPRAQVSVMPLTVQSGYTVPRRFVGQIEAGATVDLSFELGGRLTEITVDEGAAVTAGQKIARLDTALLDAEANRLASSRASTEARLTLATTQLERTQRLRDEGHVSQSVLDQAQATYDELKNAIAEIDAARAAIRINLEKSVIHAPFDGHIGNRGVDAGATLAAGQPVVTVMETSAPRLRVGLPLSLDASALDGATVDVNGVDTSARLVQFRPDIDPLTRTRTALFAIDTDRELAFGATAALLVNSAVETPGTWVPTDALQEGARGVWTLLVVDDGLVRNASVELLHAEATRAFVRGTFAPGAQVIGTGAHRVVPGQAVEIIAGEG